MPCESVCFTSRTHDTPSYQTRTHNPQFSNPGPTTNSFQTGLTLLPLGLTLSDWFIIVFHQFTWNSVQQIVSVIKISLVHLTLCNFQTSISEIFLPTRYLSPVHSPVNLYSSDSNVTNDVSKLRHISVPFSTVLPRSHYACITDRHSAFVHSLPTGFSLHRCQILDQTFIILLAYSRPRSA